MDRRSPEHVPRPDEGIGHAAAADRPIEPSQRRALTRGAAERSRAMTLNPLIEPHWMQAILPEIVLSLGGMLLILVEAFAPALKRALAPLAIFIAILTGYAVMNVPRAVYFGGTYQVGMMTQIFDFVF